MIGFIFGWWHMAGAPEVKNSVSRETKDIARQANDLNLPAEHRGRVGREIREDDVELQVNLRAPRVFPERFAVKVEGRPFTTDPLVLDRSIGPAYVQLVRHSNIFSFEYDGKGKLRIFAKGRDSSQPLTEIDFDLPTLKNVNLQTPKVDAAIAIAETGFSYIQRLMRDGTLVGETAETGDRLKATAGAIAGAAVGFAIGAKHGVKQVVPSTFLGAAAGLVAESVPSMVSKDLVFHPVLQLYKQTQELSTRTNSAIKFDLFDAGGKFVFSSYTEKQGEVKFVASGSVPVDRFVQDLKFNRTDPKVSLRSMYVARTLANVYDETVRFVNSREDNP